MDSAVRWPRGELGVVHGAAALAQGGRRAHRAAATGGRAGERESAGGTSTRGGRSRAVFFWIVRGSEGAPGGAISETRTITAGSF